MGTILGSKSHPKIDEKINQILDRFWKDFDLQMRSKFGQLSFPKIDKKSSPIFERFFENPGGRVGASSGTPGRTIGEVNPSKIDLVIRQSILHAEQHHRGCCGGLSTQA